MLATTAVVAVVAERAFIDSPGGYRGAGGGRCIYRHGLGFGFGGAGLIFDFFDYYVLYSRAPM